MQKSVQQKKTTADGGSYAVAKGQFYSIPSFSEIQKIWEYKGEQIASTAQPNARFSCYYSYSGAPVCCKHLTILETIRA